MEDVDSDSKKQGSAAPADPTQSPDAGTVVSAAATTVAAETTVPEEQESHSVNGLTTATEDDVNGDLSPPPDTPMSSNAPVNALEDEIIVGTKANGMQSSPLRVVSDQEDIEMDDVEDKSPAPTYSKRKRNSTYTDVDDDKMERSSLGDDGDVATRNGKPKTHGMAAVKGVIIGYWRDSPVPNEEDKHAVIGFIDIRERLRTRVQPTSRTGKYVAGEYPLPPGPGGSWVTFERVVFDDRLIKLDHYQVKEYVKIRCEALGNDETEEEARVNDQAAIKEAIRRVAANPPPENGQPVPIAYGRDIPEHLLVHRPEPKKRRTGGSVGPAQPAAIEPMPPAMSPAPAPIVMPAAPVQRSITDPIHGTRPTKILLGYWKGSSEEKEEDKHAVYGILGSNDMFRVKVVKETRDGRPMLSNFPAGAGALWIHYEEVEFEKHIKSLARPEVKEYVRVRQRQIDDGETPDQRIDNETKAVYEAQNRVAAALAAKTDPEAARATGHFLAAKVATNGNTNNNTDGEIEYVESRPKREYSGHELRQSRRNFPETKEATRPARHSLPDTTELRAANRPIIVDNNDRVERANSIARREIARVEAAQQRAEQRAASREAQSQQQMMQAAQAQAQQAQALQAAQAQMQSQALQPIQPQQPMQQVPAATASQHSNKALFSESMGRLNKVWASQEANRLKAGAEDAKIYMGIKYERKQTGPFQGKLVSPGTILSIDGEDYVEYRVLTKPSFF